MITDHERKEQFFAAVAAQWPGDPRALAPLAFALGVDQPPVPVTAPVVARKKRKTGKAKKRAG